MKLYRIIELILFVSLTTSCFPDNKDERAEYDKELGKVENKNYSFSSYEGLLHVTQHDDNSIYVRASSPTFGGIITNKTDQQLELKLTISNINEDVVLTSNNPSAISTPIQTDPLIKEWTFFVSEGETIDFNNSAPAVSPFNFLAMGDIQNGIDRFDEVITKLNNQKDVDFLLFLGDVTMGSTKKEFEKVKVAFEKIEFPIYSTPGNHDVFDGQLLYQQYFGRANYSYKYKGTYFTGVDSGSWSLSEQTWDWYMGWLETAKSHPHIVFSHIAPTESFGLRGGHWKSRREANAFIAHSSRGGVDAMFYGHLHTLDIFSLAGIPTYITGGAGAFQEQLDGIERHFLKVNVIPDSNEIKVSVIMID